MPQFFTRRDTGTVARPSLFRPLTFVFFLCLLLFSVASSWGEITYHVSVDGDDENAGTQGQPFGSVNRARQAVRSLLQEKSNEPVTVVIHPGGDIRDFRPPEDYPGVEQYKDWVLYVARR